MANLYTPIGTPEIYIDVAASASAASVSALGDPIVSVARFGASASATLGLMMGASAGLYFSTSAAELRQEGQMGGVSQLTFYSPLAIFADDVEEMSPMGASLTFYSTLGDPIYGVAMEGGASVTIGAEADLTLSDAALASWDEDDHGMAKITIGGVGNLRMRPDPSDNQAFEVLKRVSLIMPETIELDERGHPT